MPDTSTHNARAGHRLVALMRVALSRLEGQTHPAAIKRRRDIERTMKRIEAVLTRGQQQTEKPA